MSKPRVTATPLLGSHGGRALSLKITEIF